MLVTDEMVEKALAASASAWAAKYPETARWPEDYDEGEQLDARALSRVEIEAVAPMIRAAALEEAAKVADAAPSDAYRFHRGQCHEAIAAAIRALKTKEPT